MTDRSFALLDSERYEVTVLKRNFLVIATLSGGLVLLTIFMTGTAAFKSRYAEASKSWNREAIKATYVTTQLKETDKAHSTLVLSYDLENNTDSDYRFDDGPGVVILGRLKADGSLSQQEPIRLSYPVFLPTKQHARLAIEITERFAWPPQEDPAYIDKLREFVKQRLANIGEFVLFDQANHAQVTLPDEWKELQEAAGTS